MVGQCGGTAAAAAVAGLQLAGRAGAAVPAVLRLDRLAVGTYSPTVCPHLLPADKAGPAGSRLACGFCCQCDCFSFLSSFVGELRGPRGGKRLFLVCCLLMMHVLLARMLCS